MSDLVARERLLDYVVRLCLQRKNSALNYEPHDNTKGSKMSSSVDDANRPDLTALPELTSRTAPAFRILTQGQLRCYGLSLT